MSNDQYNKDSAPAFGGSPDMRGSQPQQEPQPQYDSTGGANANFGGNMPAQGPQNQFNMGQNQSNSEPNFGQNPNPPTNNNFMPGNSSMGQNGMPNQYPQSQNQMMGQNQMPSNQPPIAQNNYQSYPPQNYTQPMPSINPDGGQKLDTSMNTNMPQNYGQTSQMSNLPPVGMNNGSTNYQAPQDEKTYEPGMPNPYNNATAGASEGIDKGLPLSPEAMKEFEEKSARGKQYKQTDVFPAILLKNEEDTLRVIKYLKEKGVSMIAKDTLDQTALFYAARDGKVNVVNFLLENGCDPNHRDCYGQT